MQFAPTTTSSSILRVLCVTASLLLPASASALDLQGNVSCVEGHVQAFDFAELEQNFAETAFDTRSKLILRSDTAALTLEVLDVNNNSVCEEVAELRTSCTWNLTAGGTYKVKIDNSDRSTESKYRLC